MVDTLLAIDLIDLALMHKCEAVGVATDDTDLVPALLFGAAYAEGRVALLHTRNLDVQLENLMDGAGVRRQRIE